MPRCGYFVHDFVELQRLWHRADELPYSPSFLPWTVRGPLEMVYCPSNTIALSDLSTGYSTSCSSCARCKLRVGADGFCVSD